MWGSTRTDFIVWGVFMAFITALTVAGLRADITTWLTVLIVVDWALWTFITVRRFYLAWQDEQRKKRTGS